MSAVREIQEERIFQGDPTNDDLEIATLADRCFQLEGRCLELEDSLEQFRLAAFRQCLAVTLGQTLPFEVSEEWFHQQRKDPERKTWKPRSRRWITLPALITPETLEYYTGALAKLGRKRARRRIRKEISK